MKSFLKIKIKSLAAEARIIRFEEQRFKGYRRRAAERQLPAETIDAIDAERVGLWRHRTYDVRDEARAALAAYGFLRNLPYVRIEGDSASRPPLDRVAYLVAKYGGMNRDLARKQVEAWLLADVKAVQAA